MATVTDTTTDANGNIIINVSSSADDAITLATAGTYSDKNIIFNVTTPQSGVQSDWNQNDNTAPDYVKNRPFYTGDRKRIEVIPETTVELTKDDDGMFIAEAPIDSSVTLEAGTEYVINWNGVEYACTVFKLDTSVLFLGNLSIITGGESSGEPFAIILILPEGIMNVLALDATSAGETRTLSIFSMVDDIHKIDEAFMPDGYPYHYPVETTLLDNITIEMSDGQSILEPLSSVFIIGDTYTVMWDNNTYECVAYNLNGIPAIGNATLVDAVGGNNEPFLIGTMPGQATHVASQKGDTGTHTLSIVGSVLAVQTMDEEFLPDTCVKQEDLEVLNAKIPNVPSWALEETKPSYTPEEVGAMPEVEVGEVGQFVRVKSVDESGKPTEYETAKIPSPDNLTKDYLMLIDTENGFEYFIQMKNGELTSTCKAESIEVITMPTKINYLEGDKFVSDGMVLRVNRKDGTFDDVVNYKYDNIVSSSTYIITYTEYGEEYATEIQLNITGSVSMFQDFEYVDNGNGTYTITGWKGTLNGKESTQIVIPDGEFIIL